jgi:hypothetical protein
MGTKGYIAVAASINDIRRDTPILAVLSDGSASNLLALGHAMMKAAKELHCLTGFRKANSVAVSEVMRKVCKDNDFWPFVDIKGNAEWVSYSAILNPKTGVTSIFAGNLDDLMQ